MVEGGAESVKVEAGVRLGFRGHGVSHLRFSAFAHGTTPPTLGVGLPTRKPPQTRSGASQDQDEMKINYHISKIIYLSRRPNTMGTLS